MSGEDRPGRTLVPADGAHKGKMPSMRSKGKRVVAVTAADLHLSHKCPAFRSKEDDWYGVQAKYLRMLGGVADVHQAVILYAGDIFHDGWRPHNCPPELTNFAAKFMPKGYAVPGQHDLPHHRLDDLHRSAYWTLRELGVIEDLPPGVAIQITGKDIEFPHMSAYVYGFPWGSKIQPPQTSGEHCLNIAVIHDCVWLGECSHEGIDQSKALYQWWGKLRGYDVAVFGDNHKGFSVQRTKTTPAIINNGTFLVRNKGEQLFPPKIGLIYEDGTVSQLALDTKDDIYLQENEVVVGSQEYDSSEFMEELEKELVKGIDFAKTFLRKIKNPKVRPAVAELLSAILEEETEE